MAKSFFDKLITSVAKSADKAISDAAKQRERERKLKEKERVNKVSTSYGKIPAAKSKEEAHSINNAYRQSDYDRWKDMDFVIGYEIRPSNNSKLNKECCGLLAGKYPKSFEWHGWFDGCACHTVSVLTNQDDFIAQQKAYISGKKYVTKSNPITDYPDNFKVLGGFNKSDKLTKQQAKLAYKRIYDKFNNK